MKTAITTDGKSIIASADAPQMALCPYCGGQVILRHRRGASPKGRTYFWRHQDNIGRNCPGRSQTPR